MEESDEVVRNRYVSKYAVVKLDWNNQKTFTKFHDTEVEAIKEAGRLISTSVGKTFAIMKVTAIVIPAEIPVEVLR